MGDVAQDRRALLVRPHRGECVADCVTGKEAERWNPGSSAFPSHRPWFGAEQAPVRWKVWSELAFLLVVGVAATNSPLVARLGGVEDCVGSPAAIRGRLQHHFVIKEVF